MNNTQLFDALSYVNETLVDRAASVAKTAPAIRKGRLLRWGGAVAAVLIAVTVAAVTVPMLTITPSKPPESPRFVLQRVYKNVLTDVAWGPEEGISMYVEDVGQIDHPEGQVFRMRGVEYPLTYVRSLYYPTEDTMMHEYSLEIDGLYRGDSPYVMLTDDGALFRTGFFSMGEIDMSAVENDDELIRLVEEALAEFVDFDAYEFVEITPNGYRQIKWYNKLGEYILPGAVSVGVMSSDGQVSSLYKCVAQEVTVTEADLPTDDEIRALVTEDIQNTHLVLHGPAELGEVVHKEIIERDGVECVYVSVESEYTFKADTGKEYRNKQELWYIIPVESPASARNIQQPVYSE